MKILPRMGFAAMAALVPLSFTATELNAQEACQATVQPAEVASGNAAERIEVALTQSIGSITSFESAEQSGLKLAEPGDLPRMAMAADDDRPTPIQMANEENRVTIWINSVDAEPGQYQFLLLGSEGECQGTVTVGSGR